MRGLDSVRSEKGIEITEKWQEEPASPREGLQEQA